LHENRNVVIYDLNSIDIDSILSMLNLYLENSFETNDLRNLFYLFLKNNTLKYFKDSNSCCVIKKNSNDSTELKAKIENVEVENIEVENIEVENIEVENIEVENVEVENVEVENVVLENNSIVLKKNDSVDSLLEELNIDLNFINYYANLFLKIKQINFRDFFYNEYLRIFNIYVDKDLNFIKKDFISLYIFYNTFINLSSLEFNNLNNIFKGFCNTKKEYDIKNELELYELLLNATYNINICTSIDLFMLIFFKNILFSLNNNYNNFMLSLKEKIIILNYGTEKNNNNVFLFFNFNNKNIKSFFSLIYTKLYDYFFLSSVMVKKLENLKYFISLYMDLLRLYNNNKNLVIKALFRQSVCNMIKVDDLYLINLLLNVKNPLLLYNLIALDLNIFLTNIFNIKNIIDNPSYNKVLYKKLLNQFINKPSNIECNCNESFESFFSLNDLSVLSHNILSLDNYITFNKGFLNLTNFSLLKTKNMEYNELELLLNNNNLNTLFNMDILVNIEPNIFVSDKIIEITKDDIKPFVK